MYNIGDEVSYPMHGAGKIVSIEENWIKVEEKNKVRIINGDIIRDISIMPEKYQK